MLYFLIFNLFLILLYNSSIFLPLYPIHVALYNNTLSKYGFSCGKVVKNLSANAGNARDVFNPCVGKIPWSRKWQPVQYSCLENPIERRAWQATAHGVAKSWTQLSATHRHTHRHTHTHTHTHYFLPNIN